MFFYFALVEGLVAQNAVEVETILPGLEEDDRRFLAVWERHEVAHGIIFDALCVELDLSPAGPPLVLGARRSFCTLSALSRQRWWHDVFRLVYLLRGAMHERLTLDAYSRIGARLERWGEHALVATVTDPIRRQEAGHLGYYRAAAAAQRDRLTRRSSGWPGRSVSTRTRRWGRPGPGGANVAERSAASRATTSMASSRCRPSPIGCWATDGVVCPASWRPP